MSDELKHTPGPWTADWDDSGQWYVDIGGLLVSGLALRGDTGGIEAANAQLIALAPDHALIARLMCEGLLLVHGSLGPCSFNSIGDGHA